MIYSDPPETWGRLLVPSFAQDHSCSNLMATGRYLVNINVQTIDILAESAGSTTACMIAEIVNRWFERVAGDDWIGLRIDNLTMIAPTLPPEHIDQPLDLDQTQVNIVSCDKDLLACTGNPHESLTAESEKKSLSWVEGTKNKSRQVRWASLRP